PTDDSRARRLEESSAHSRPVSNIRVRGATPDGPTDGDHHGATTNRVAVPNLCTAEPGPQYHRFLAQAMPQLTSNPRLIPTEPSTKKPSTSEARPLKVTSGPDASSPTTSGEDSWGGQTSGAPADLLERVALPCHGKD